MAEVIVAPRSGPSQLNKYPNEDSLDLEFSDANLFGFNRFPGIDRLEGGDRLNLGLHSAWYLNGTTFDGLVGQSYRTFKDDLFPQNSGLHNQVSDVVARATFAPTSWLDLTYRTRLDQATLATNMIDTFARIGTGVFSVNAGYLYTADNPYQVLRPAGTAAHHHDILYAAAGSHAGGHVALGGVPAERRAATQPADQPDGLVFLGRGVGERVLHHECAADSPLYVV